MTIARARVTRSLQRRAGALAPAASAVSRKYLAITVLLGLAFLAVKGIEYAEKLTAGLGPGRTISWVSITR